MNEAQWQEMIEDYRAQGVPGDQQMLIALLREAQEADGGVLSRWTISALAQAYGIRESLIDALIRRVSGLYSEEAAHRLEICGICRAGAPLLEMIARTYGVKSGEACDSAGFVYRVVPCMKNCKNGPCVRWDGQLYSSMDKKRLRALIEGGK